MSHNTWRGQEHHRKQSIGWVNKRYKDENMWTDLILTVTLFARCVTRAGIALLFRRRWLLPTRIWLFTRDLLNFYIFLNIFYFLLPVVFECPNSRTLHCYHRYNRPNRQCATLLDMVQEDTPLIQFSVKKIKQKKTYISLGWFDIGITFAIVNWDLFRVARDPTSSNAPWMTILSTWLWTGWPFTFINVIQIICLT